MLTLMDEKNGLDFEVEKTLTRITSVISAIARSVTEEYGDERGVSIFANAIEDFCLASINGIAVDEAEAQKNLINILRFDIDRPVEFLKALCKACSEYFEFIKEEYPEYADAYDEYLKIARGVLSKVA